MHSAFWGKLNSEKKFTLNNKNLYNLYDLFSIVYDSVNKDGTWDTEGVKDKLVHISDVKFECKKQRD